MKEKIINLFKNLLLTNIVFFIILAPFSKKAVKISILISLVLCIVITIVEFGSNFHKHLIKEISIAKPLVFFCVALVLSTIFSLDPYYSHAVLFERYLVYILFFLVGNYFIRSKKNLSVLIGAIILAGILMGVGGIWDYFCLNLVRLHTSFGRMISYASFLILQIPLCFIVLFYSKNKLLKSGAFIGIILLFFCLILNATRAAWVAIVVSLIIISFFKNRKFACGLLICIIIGGLFLPAQLKYRAITTADPLTWGERVPLWNIAIRMFNDYPIFGVGLGMQEKLFSTYWKQSIYFPTFKYWHSHNNYLEIAAETGIVGILSFLYIFVTFLKNAYSRGKLLKDNESIVFLGLTGCIIATLILAMSDSNVTVGVQDAAVFWFIFGIVSGLIFFRKTPENIA